MSSWLRVKDLEKSFRSGDRQLRVLNGLDLEMERGELLVITGASGSGKSTFLHLVGAMERADAGAIEIGGLDLNGLDNYQRAGFRNEQVGFIFQSHHLLPEFTALENVMLPLLLRREVLRMAREKSSRLLDQVGLADRSHHRPGELSGGEQQRVAVARALVGGPRILLADEPTGDLDDETSQEIHDLIVQVHREGQLTAIVVTHDMRLASSLGRHMCLENGRLRAAS